MTPSEIKPGMKFGNWEVIKFDHSNKHRIKYFLCRCAVCGKYRPVRATSLIDGTSTACSKECADSLLGQTIGAWTVLRLDPNKPRYYICQCECGTIKSVFKSSLKNGMSKSCGCKHHENLTKKNKENAESHIGEKYGALTILDAFIKDEQYWYKCKCDCGAIIDVKLTKLLNGYVYSCGCINSKANEMMSGILNKYHIPFVREKRFEDCKDKGTLPFDFALYNRSGELIGLIENNGSQHYSASGAGWNTKEQLELTQKHDYIKMRFAEDNRIPLLIIPYQYFNELEKFLITSDFWKIIIKNFND